MIIILNTIKLYITNYNYNICSNIDLYIYLKSRDTKMILVDF